MEENNDDNILYTSAESIPRLYRFRTHEIKHVRALGNPSLGLNIPLPRSGHRIVVYNGSIYVFGGYSRRDRGTNEIIQPPNYGTLFLELWEFNLASKTWERLYPLGEMPDTLASFTVLQFNKHMILHGGTGFPFGEINSNNTNLFDLDSLEWFPKITRGDIPEALYGQAAALHDKKMYIVGGTSGYIYTLAVHSLHLSTFKWTRLDTLNIQPYKPHARYRHEIVIYKDQIYVFGGGTAFLAYDLQNIPIFDLYLCRWSIQAVTSPVFPEPRLCHGCVQNSSDVYMFGGHDGNQIFNDIWKIDLDQMSWTKIDTTLPIPLYFHSVAATEEGQVFIFGGVTDTHEEIRVNDIFTMWMKVPSLSSMCWQAILEYIPNISNLKKENLFKAGVSQYYLNKIKFIKS